MTRTAPISAILPAYNAERYLAEALESVRAQTLLPQEILVVDDGSTDATAALARNVAGVTVLGGPNGGISAALNRGVAASSGEYLAFLDADDLWLPEKLARQLAAMEQAPAPDIVFGAMMQFISPDCDEGTRQRLECPSQATPGLVASAMLVRRSSFARVGEFRTDLRVGQFVDWCARAIDLGLHRIVLDALVLQRRLHGGNISLRQPEARVDFARVARAALERRRPRS